MLYTCVVRFDVMENLVKFLVFGALDLQAGDLSVPRHDAPQRRHTAPRQSRLSPRLPAIRAYVTNLLRSKTMKNTYLKRISCLQFFFTESYYNPYASIIAFSFCSPVKC